MPTPSGKPKIGEVWVHKPTGARCEVLARTTGEIDYSVTMRKPDGQVAMLTEFPYWLKDWRHDPEGSQRATAWYALWSTRNGQKQWQGPYPDRAAAAASLDMITDARALGTGFVVQGTRP